MKHIPTQLLVWLLAVLMVWPWPLRLAAQSNSTTFKPLSLPKSFQSVSDQNAFN